MKLYDQTTFSDPVEGTFGDCTRACIQTLLQDDLDQLPHPITEDGESNLEFWDALEEIYGKSLRFKVCKADTDYRHLPRVVLACGPTVRTQRTGAHHMVVYDRVGERVIHDPHPSRKGLTEITRYCWLIDSR